LALGSGFAQDDGQGSTKHSHMLTHVINVFQMQTGNPDPLSDVSLDHRAVGKDFGSIIKDASLLCVGVISLEILGHVGHGSYMLE
jgi:hypothetical protein